MPSNFALVARVEKLARDWARGMGSDTKKCPHRSRDKPWGHIRSNSSQKDRVLSPVIRSIDAYSDGSREGTNGSVSWRPHLHWTQKRKFKQIVPADVNGSVYTAWKQHQRKFPQNCVQCGLYVNQSVFCIRLTLWSREGRYKRVCTPWSEFAMPWSTQIPSTSDAVLDKHSIPLFFCSGLRRFLAGHGTSNR